MAAPQSPYSTAGVTSPVLRFHSTNHLLSFLDVPEPHNRCISPAPKGKYPPRCLRKVSPRNQAKFHGLLAELSNSNIPSSRADHLLRELCTCVVCGITKQHQHEAPGIYKKWLDKLWDAYLRLNHLDRGLCASAPRCLSEVEWEKSLEHAWPGQADLLNDSSSDDDARDGDTSGDYASDESIFSNEGHGDDTLLSDITANSNISDHEDSSPQRCLSDLGRPETQYTSTATTPGTTWVSDGDNSISAIERDDGTDQEEAEASSQGPERPTDDQIHPSMAPETGDENTQPGAQPFADSGISQEDDFPVELLNLLRLTDDDDTDDDTDADSGTIAGAQLASSSIPAPLTIPSPFRPYRQLSPLALFKQLLNQLTRTVSTSLLGPGYIYAYSRQSTPGYIKIGYVLERTRPPHQNPQRNPVDRRLAAWAACGSPVEEVFRLRVPCAIRRIEGLIHTTLQQWRCIEDPPCERCVARGRSGAHNEWFRVDKGVAWEVVRLWNKFSKQSPYDQFGRLVDFWSRRVKLDRCAIRAGDSVKTWLDRMPGMIEELRGYLSIATSTEN